jgi:hypothetical protein
MVRVCPHCHWIVGIKPPWLDLRITRALCTRCYRQVVSRQGYGLGR